MSDFVTLTGGCQCGAVRYEVRAPATDLYHCHCAMCRKVHGASFGTYAVAPKEAVVITQGEENLTRFDSSPGVSRLFCKTCGCQLFNDLERDTRLRWFMPGTLDGGPHPGAADRERHTYVDSKLPWLHLDDKLPRMSDPPA